MTGFFIGRQECPRLQSSFRDSKGTTPALCGSAVRTYW
jgi:hypothetical protein